MTQQAAHHPNTVDAIRENWKIIILVLAIVSTSAVALYRVDQVEAQVARHETQMDIYDTTFTGLQVTLEGVKTDLAWIRVTLEELKQRGE